MLSMLLKHRSSTLLILFAASIPLLGWWLYGLFDLDEGFYAAVTSEMNRRGDWITPYFNGQPWFEKPILLYWLAKPSLLWFGTAFGPRLPDVVATIGTYGVTFWFARRRFGRVTAAYSTLILASCPLVVALGRMMMTDPLLLFFLTAAFCTFWESVEGDTRWRLGTAAALGFGVLAKGPIACVLFVPPSIWTYLRWPDKRVRFKGHWLSGVVLFCGVVASWYWPAYMASGNIFVQEFLIKQNFGRFSGGDQAHSVDGPLNLVFYPAVILITFLPWSPFLVSAWRSAERSELNGYLKSWFLTVLIFFTVTKAKLPHYILPLSVPLALIVGQRFALRSETRPRLLAWLACALIGVTVLANFGFNVWYHGVAIGSVRLPGSQEEAHLVANYVRTHASPTDTIVEFQMGRRQKDRGTMHMRIQETLEPSVHLYLNRNTIDTDDFRRLSGLPGRVWIITRWDRISPEQVASTPGLRRVPVSTPNDLFRLYVLERAST